MPNTRVMWSVKSGHYYYYYYAWTKYWLQKCLRDQVSLNGHKFLCVYIFLPLCLPFLLCLFEQKLPVRVLLYRLSSGSSHSMKANHLFTFGLGLVRKQPRKTKWQRSRGTFHTRLSQRSGGARQPLRVKCCVSCVWPLERCPSQAVGQHI